MSGAAELLRGVTRLASPPQIFLRIEELLASPNTAIADFARVIEGDTGLTARLLRLANSPLYGRVARVATVHTAISMIGTQQLRELALACSVLRVFRDIPAELLDMEMFWRHSVACGVLARSAAVLAGEGNVERVFAAGLLHDVGRLVMLMERPRTMGRVLEAARARGILLYEAEREEFGFDHTEVGALLLRSWKVPERLSEAVGCHHAPHTARGFPMDAALLHVADIMVNALALGSSGQRLVPPLDPRAWETLGLPVDRLPALLAALQEQYDDAVAFVLGAG